jgi:hypothetical protein
MRYPLADHLRGSVHELTYAVVAEDDQVEARLDGLAWNAVGLSSLLTPRDFEVLVLNTDIHPTRKAVYALARRRLQAEGKAV